MILYLLLGVLLTYLFLIFYINGTPRKSNEPPLIGYLIPYIGTTVQFGQDATQFAMDNYKKYGDVFTAIIQGQRTHFILNPDDFSHVFKDEKLFRFEDISDRFGERLTGLPFPFEHTVASISTFQGLTNPEKLERLTSSFANCLKKEVAAIKDGKLKFYDFTKKLVYRASSKSLFGESFDAEGTQDPFYTYVDGCKFLLAGGLMQYFGYKAAQARTKVIKGLTDAIPEEGSDFIKLRRDYFIENNLSLEELPTHNLSIIFAAVTNTAPAIFWTLYYTLKNPEFIPQIIKENKEYYENNFDLKYYNQEGILEKLINESLRITTGTSTSRNLSKDFVLKTKSGKEFDFRKGDDVMLLFSYVNHNDEFYEDPKKFEPNRDFKKKTLQVFGGGKHLCPGRLFFRNEARVVLVELLNAFDMKIESKELNYDWTCAPLSVLCPVNEIEVEIKRK